MHLLKTWYCKLILQILLIIHDDSMQIYSQSKVKVFTKVWTLPKLISNALPRLHAKESQICAEKSRAYLIGKHRGAGSDN